MTKVVSIGKNLRVSAKKVRPVAQHFQGKKALTAFNSLKFVSKKAAAPLAKVLKSAIANAEHNAHLTPEKLIIKEIQVNEGPVLKRWRPVSRGSSHPILRRTSQIKIILEDK